MQRSKILTILLILALALGACNYPGAPGGATPTARIRMVTATPGAQPTATNPLPTDTPPLPSDTPPPPAPTDTQGPPPPTPAPPTPIPPTATRVLIVPLPKALFTATFDGGTFTFRTHENSHIVIPKTVNVKSGACKEGSKISDHITFEPPPFFDIDENLKFTMSQGTQVTISGQFFAANQARGTITLHLKAKNSTCNIGPIAWTATATGQ